MSFKRKLRRAAERKDIGFNFNTLAKAVHGMMYYNGLELISAKRMPEKNGYDFTFTPDKDYSGNKDIMQLCECISLHMDCTELQEVRCSLNDKHLTISARPMRALHQKTAPAAENKKHLAPISTQKQSVLV